MDKINEIVRALKLNELYSKNEILEMYLNNIFFGNLNYGIESASIDFFNKSASELDLAECSYLMGVPQWPGVYNPYGNVERGKERQYLVLSAMLDQGYITQIEFDSAYSQQLEFILEPTEVRAPHFLQFINDNIVDSYSIDQNTIYNNLTINTTYNYDIHKSILTDLKPYIQSLNENNVNNSAVVILDKDNNIEIMIGSIDFFNDDIEGKFNSALGNRQPGTALMPLIYKYAVLSSLDTNEKYSNSPFELTVQRGESTEQLTIFNFINGYQENSSISEALDKTYPVAFTNFVQNVGLSTIENYLAQYRLYDFEPNICQLSLIVEGCEISLFELTLAYSNLSNTTINNKFNFISSINNQLMSMDVINQNELDLFPENYKSDWFVYAGDTVNNKDIFAFAKSKEYTVGVWVGNTKGEELINIRSADVMPRILEIITNRIN
jgi:membrane peptidoglycan carboxypeptidase